MIGGHLADPVKNLATIFHKGSVWEDFPYLLPNLIVVLFIMTSGLLGFFFLEESHPQMQNQSDVGRKISSWFGKKIAQLFGCVDRKGYLTLTTIEHPIILADVNNDHIKGEEASLENADEIEAHPPIASTQTDLPRPTTPAYTWEVILQILTVSLLAFHKVSSDVIIPTFLATSSLRSPLTHSIRDLFKFKVGFGMTSPSIANVLLTQAVIATVSQILIVPKIIDCFGPLNTFRWALFVFPWLYCITPFTARFPYPLSLMAILLDLWIKCVLANLGYISSSILWVFVEPYICTI